MTIQNWTLTAESAAIYCDTLATGGADNSPSAFMSKAWVVPHQSIMIAAMDWAYPAQTLYSHLAMGYAPTCLDELVPYASNQFREAAAAMPGSRANYPGAAVGMFAWNADRNEIEGWMFRTECGFAGERLPTGGFCLMNPTIRNFSGKDWCGIALEQQRQDRTRPDRHRNNIGGSLVGYEMKVDPSGKPPVIMITNFGKMPHYDEQAAGVAAFRALHGTVHPAYVRT